jgi:hypothetical protein
MNAGGLGRGGGGRFLVYVNEFVKYYEIDDVID